MRPIFTLIAILFLLLTTSCAPVWSKPGMNGSWEPPSKTYICLELPPEQIGAAKEAVNQWDMALGQWRHIQPIEGHDPACSYNVVETISFNVYDPKALAWTSTLGGSEISMRKGAYEQDTMGILLHELGHAFGAQHVEGTLMNPRWSMHSFICPDATTVAQVAAWNKINLTLLRWCVL